MKKWLKQIRAALRMGLTWGIPLALVGFLIEFIHNAWPNPLGRLVDIWPAALGIPAFLGGVTFSLLLSIVARRRRFEELSLAGFTTLGALGGLLVSLGPAVMVTLGLASIHGPSTVWQITAPLMVPLTVFGATAAAGSLVLARRAGRRELLGPSERAADAQLLEGEALESPEGR